MRAPFVPHRIIRPRRSRSAAAYSRQTFPWTICRSVGPYVRTCVGLSVGLSRGKTADRIRMLFGIIGRTGAGMRQIVEFGIGPREGVLLGPNLGRAIVTNVDFTAYVCDSTATRPSSQITLGKLVTSIGLLVVQVLYNIWATTKAIVSDTTQLNSTSSRVESSWVVSLCRPTWL